MYLNFGEQPDLFGLQLGADFIPLIEKGKKAPLLDAISKYRKKIDEESGLLIPPVHIVENKSLKPSEYVILFNGVEVGRSDIPTGYCYCMDLGDVKTPLNSDLWIKTKEPAFEMDAFLVPEENIKEIKKAGYLYIPSEQIISIHLSEIIRINRTKILNQSMVNILLDKVCKINPDVITDVVFTNKFETSDMKILLNRLLSENVSIRDMNTILETIADNIKEERNPILLAEKVRERLAYSFIPNLADENKCIHVIRLSNRFMELLADHIYYPSEKNKAPYFEFQPNERRMFLEKISEGLTLFNEKVYYPVFIIISTLRLAFVESLRREMPGVAVISDLEMFNLDNNFELKVEKEIDLDDEYKSLADKVLESMLNTAQEL